MEMSYVVARMRSSVTFNSQLFLEQNKTLFPGFEQIIY